MTTRSLNLDDIQGNVTRAYGRFSYPFARYFFLHIKKGEAGRKFVDTVRTKVTTAARWPMNADQPKCTVNIGFTFYGMLKLGVPSRTLQAMPAEFIEGMKARAFILGDRDVTKTINHEPHWDKDWDKIWQDNRRTIGHKHEREVASSVDDDDNVHIWISLNAQLKNPDVGDDIPHDELEEKTGWLQDLCSDSGVRILATNGRNGDQEYQSASAVFQDVSGVKIPTPKEHFGFSDGIGDPVFKGQYEPEREKIAVIGRGKWMDAEKGWEPLATGEFILGHPDESQELPPTSVPTEFMKNGTYMAYRKLHENVKSFNDVLEAEATAFAAQVSCSQEEAEETLRAKMCGRWADGVPLSKVPTYDEWIQFGIDKGFRLPDGSEPKELADILKAQKCYRKYLSSSEVSDFRYADDMLGYKCPLGSHLRRMNTRDYLDPTNKVDTDKDGKQIHDNKQANTALNKRRRILRRGLPYASDNKHKDDETEQGIAMMIMGASLFRQFEFVQQQWLQYGMDFHQGNSTCPMLGNHDYHKRHTVQSDPASGKPPFVMSKLKTFVECRGGDYFFIPSMTALRMMAMGIVDPT